LNRSKQSKPDLALFDEGQDFVERVLVDDELICAPIQ